ncbi:MAG TPA: hypothetical protein DIV44_01090 [Leeuwenhoekiella sp.]|uniref:hypothetical protein n=1 Tax=Leeuwenhoekiella palythoae TaxID=573501 RepID=UPI000C451467|nr:hypothetical protein [Leeuwenhoekiella palythoae]MBH12727.1 hypothetical protein [Leeuwenhoekiella sp.]UBZ10193.1 hypothetical protein LDL79_15505 [Leeuwenhoekiella palythoae]HAX14889.1 hypothetical protein [Leeuwenhoekiella sp.]HBO29429.1 hypothetical protein [Leeuwenhoekiella sp.]HCQ75378.1 hypothetical protein [Leeuwenhoekiella sp.]|tara:strand:- start:6994 stop:7530 length:537 start_codon:yes stop_codon:yes gene_type:complete
MIKRIGFLILIVTISILFASIYGFLHNQASYSISTEYFTKFKFQQFGFVEYGLDTPRVTAGLIGVWSTWWFGLLFGLINAIIGFCQPTVKVMWKSAFGATIRTFLIVIIIGVLGIAVGYATLIKYQIEWNIPSDIINRRDFICAGTMHNFSYLGGFIGMLYGIRYQLKIRKVNALNRP